MKFLEDLQSSKSINGILILVGLAVTVATVMSVALQLDEYMAAVPELNLPVMEQTVVAAQTATEAKAHQTAINSTAVAMGIPTLTHTPGWRETQGVILAATVRAEDTSAEASVIEETTIARLLTVPSPTTDPVALSLEIADLAAGPSRNLGNSFWALVTVLIVIVGLMIYPLIFIKYLRSSRSTVAQPPKDASEVPVDDQQ